MFVQYGNYRHASGEVTLTPISRELKFTEAQIAYAFTQRWSLKGFLQAPDVPSLTLAIALLEAAYLIPGQPLGLFNDDGSATAHGVLASAAFGGVRVVSGPTYPVGDGTEYVTHRQYEIVLEWDVHDPAVGMMAWKESVHYTGGGPGFAVLEPRVGTAVIQQVTQSRAYRATQVGNAVGHLSYPSPPSPLWPNLLIEDPDFEFSSPTRQGNQFRDYPISWSYRYASPVPFPSAFPNAQPNL